jgi:hypothetical protein
MLIMLIVILKVLAMRLMMFMPSKAKSYSCDSLKLVHKNWQEEIKFTFDVAKCDKIFDELHKAG